MFGTKPADVNTLSEGAPRRGGGERPWLLACINLGLLALSACILLATDAPAELHLLARLLALAVTLYWAAAALTRRTAVSFKTAGGAFKPEARRIP